MEQQVPQWRAYERPDELLAARADGSGEDVTPVEVGGSAILVATGVFRLP